MNFLDQIVPFIIISGGIHGILLAITILVYSKANYNRILALNIIIFSLLIAIPELIRVFPDIFVHLLGVPFPLFFLIGPSLFLYIKFRLATSRKLHKEDALHLLPFIIATLLLLPEFAVPTAVKLDLIASIKSSNQLPILWEIGWVLELMHILIYLQLSFKLVKTKRGPQSNWLQVIVKANFIVWSIYLIWLSLNLLMDGKTIYTLPYYLFGTLISILIYYIGYQAILNKNVLKEKLDYVKPNLTDVKEMNTLRNDLLNIVQENKVHHDPEISLHSLSKLLATSPNKLSELLNRELEQNFNDFINSKRIKDAAEMLQNKRNVTIIEIAYEVGFQSKSTFNKSFKHFVGMTPTQYINSKVKGTMDIPDKLRAE